MGLACSTGISEQRKADAAFPQLASCPFISRAPWDNHGAIRDAVVNVSQSNNTAII